MIEAQPTIPRRRRRDQNALDLALSAGMQVESTSRHWRPPTNRRSCGRDRFDERLGVGDRAVLRVEQRDMGCAEVLEHLQAGPIGRIVLSNRSPSESRQVAHPCRRRLEHAVEDLVADLAAADDDGARARDPSHRFGGERGQGEGQERQERQDGREGRKGGKGKRRQNDRALLILLVRSPPIFRSCPSSQSCPSRPPDPALQPIRPSCDPASRPSRPTSYSSSPG